MAPDFDPVPFAIGSWFGAQPAQATYAEVLVYDHALSEVERSELECQLADKYGVALDSSVACP